MSAAVVGMRRPDAQQRAAADPRASVWVSASAGSGKTKVLTDRVLALLLEGTPPQHILCLTFTRAAASEMANRVTDTLRRWAIVEEEKLRSALEDLTGITPDDEKMVEARRLLARVLDVPGGLKIQTIHAFCESLLGRFPVEAGLAPHFQVVDERSAVEMIGVARDAVLARSEHDPPLQDALNIVTRYVDEIRFAELMTALSGERHRLERLLDRHRDVTGATAAIRARLELRDGDSGSTIIAAAVREDAFDRAALTGAAQALLGSPGSTDQARGRTISEWLAADATERASGFQGYAAAYLTTQGELRAGSRIATKAVREVLPEVVDILHAEGNRLIRVKDRLRAVVTAEATAALIELGDALIAAYTAAKRSIARLDYDDLILLAGNLLKKPDIAPWVLFKLDGGIDHILIDEAQDTSPQQWDVVARLAEEFFAGEGGRDVPRTIFAVGDAKQSIYSFQHADAEEFRRMRAYFSQRVNDSGAVWRSVELDVSFRSTEAVLEAVDQVFATEQAAHGVVEPGATLRHFANRSGHAGLVELWPPVVPRATQDETEWSPPVERRAGDDPRGRLARLLAQRISSWIGTETLESRGRKVRAGDIMILVRTRTSLVEMLVRSLKDCGVSVSGIDRMVLSDQIAVMDLIALGRFLLLPEDDLTLATVLKGPFVGLNDEDLFELAWGRGNHTVWQRLNAAAIEDARLRAIRDWLGELLAAVDFRRPYELYVHILTSPVPAGADGRHCMLSRLGLDADDPIDEFLNLALAFERGHAGSLEGFLHWVEAGEVTVKRDLEQAGRDEVRVMTVHGAKGLQAPIVILPDTMSKPRNAGTILWDGDVPLWSPGVAYRDPHWKELLQAQKSDADDEYRRLLYVAMTRAEDRLYVCGVEGKKAPPEDCWYHLVRQGLSGCAEPVSMSFRPSDAEAFTGTGLRLAGSQRVPSEPDGPASGARQDPLPPESWMLRAAPREARPPKPLAPSRSAEIEPAVASPAAAADNRRYQRGIVIHRLLEVLPELPSVSRRGAAARYLARPLHRLDTESQAEIVDEVMAVLEDEAFGPVFGPGSRAEVPVTGLVAYPEGPAVISGRIDRLLIAGELVIIVDFKSNRPPPATMDDVTDVYWRQMGEYRDLMTQIYPGRRVRCALLWTDGPRLMELRGPRLDRRPKEP
ncbi:MAG: double-strand break repair helicase AddA [Rhodospirillales bacterium]|nr:MAG: double-strand break repair helicase AddA [Rhodospirillales bacterium]